MHRAPDLTTKILLHVSFKRKESYISKESVPARSPCEGDRRGERRSAHAEVQQGAVQERGILTHRGSPTYDGSTYDGFDFTMVSETTHVRFHLRSFRFCSA
ncbi:hypothetical protein M514_07908 [Trichuris suis]|uniref:Uncharacterized protein n=1 Tax=Trichuris suis TaxID=68888 RepID=A0A085NJ27_9BILA|nr:hypothetical protein M513_07908 [Trichuris suis]KFD69473.1 hypothetical protein M514_07908 [Trichuris suis]